MKATELMIGDWVLDGKNIAQIVMITCDGIIGTTFNESSNIELIEPIPLTPEILEKNGFIKDADEDDMVVDMYHLLVPTGFEINSYTIQVRLFKKPICGVSALVKCWGWIPPYNGGMNDIHLCSANYVHELQHAMRLCGIEKEIEL